MQSTGQTTQSTSQNNHTKYNARTDPLFKHTEIPKVANTLDLNVLKFYYKYIHGKLPSYFYSFNSVTEGSQHSYNAVKWAKQNWAHTSRILWQQAKNLFTGLSKLSPAALIRKNCYPEHSGILVRHQISFPKPIPNWVLHCQLLHLSLQSAIMGCMFFQLPMKLQRSRWPPGVACGVWEVTGTAQMGSHAAVVAA